MQQQMQIPLIRGDKVDPTTDYRDALAVNMYAVKKDILGAAGYMLSYPGLSQVATASGIDRGAVYNERLNTHFRVSGTKLISVDSAGVVTELGAISGTDQVTMDGFYSFNTQGVIADGQMFLYSPTVGFVTVTDPDLGTPIDGIWINQYYFMTDGEYLFHTDLSSTPNEPPDITAESSIDPHKFATAEFSPDPSLGLGKTQDNKVIVFGRYSIEFFVDQANPNFAFTRVESRAQKIGIVSTHAKTEVMGMWFFVGGRKNESLGVYLLGVGQSTKVSSREIDKILAKYTEPELQDIRVESRVQDDGTFLLVHLPNEVLCLNVQLVESFGKESAWSILRSGTDTQPYRAINGVYDPQRGYWIYGDKLSGVLGKLDSTIFSQYGEKQEWFLYTPMIDLQTKSIDELEIETIPGNNVTDDATVSLSITYDGQNWSMDWWDLYGEPLNYNQKYILRRLGYVDSWIAFRFRGVTTSRMAFAGMVITVG